MYISKQQFVVASVVSANQYASVFLLFTLKVRIRLDDYNLESI